MYIDQFIKSTEIKKMLEETRLVVAKESSLKKHLEEMCYVLYVERDKGKFLNELKSRHEALENLLGDLNRVFSLYIYEQGLDDLVKFYSDRKIPDNILYDVMNDINIWVDNYYVQHGKYGFDEDIWLVNHIHGDIFGLGRLQFAFGKYQSHTEVYKYDEDILVVAVKDTPINESGEYADQDNVFIKAKYEKLDGDILSAHLVNTETGIIDLTPSNIDLSKYKLLLKPGDDILGVHIPASGKMDYDECLKSFDLARVFFPKHFPEFNFKAFTCDSWLLSNEIKGIVSENSNIYKFSSLFTKYISKGTHPFIYKWIFGFDCEDVAKMQPTSSMAKKVQQLVLSGGDIYSRGGFILR